MNTNDTVISKILSNSHILIKWHDQEVANMSVSLPTRIKILRVPKKKRKRYYFLINVKN